MLDRVISVITAVAVTVMPGVSGIANSAVCVPDVSRVPDVSTVAAMSAGVTVTVVHEPAYCHDAEAYAADGETDEIKVHY